MQSAFAIGYGAAAVVAALVLPRFGWRAVFFVGVLPALFAFWVQRRVEEPEMWRAAASRLDRRNASPADLFRDGLAGLTTAVALMNAFALFGWWAFWSWLPSFLTLPAAQGGLGLQLLSGSALIVVMQVGMWLGYASFGYVSDHVGRKPAYVAYLVVAAVSMAAYTAANAPLLLLALGPVVAFFATGHFSGFSVVTAEIYRTEIRATAQGFTYNVGRLTSALAPFAVGSLAETQGFGTALRVAALAFALAAVVWLWIPETKGRTLA
jgi:MFS family permease